MTASETHFKLSEFLKKQRNQAGLSQKEVADCLGYSTPQFISNWERGLSSPPMKALRTLADLYRIRPEELYELMVESTLARIRSDLESEFRQFFRKRSRSRR
jgi:transcriptional regulator with XRE-family HTH domain